MFTPIEFHSWPRREMFYYFSKMAPTGYSLTVNLDVTHLRKTVKDYFFPSVEAGKMTEVDGKWNMPLSLTCHHATTDGWHVHRFLESLQESMDKFQQFL